MNIALPASKSLSNRYLILRHLSKNKLRLKNLSLAQDTVLLNKALTEKTTTLYVGDGGTTLRFLIPVICLKNDGKTYTLVIGEQLAKRPLDAFLKILQQLGINTNHNSNTLIIQTSLIHCNEIKIEKQVTSQFISALMLVAPFLPDGLSIKLPRQVVSQSYITMTASVLKSIGCEVRQEKSMIHIDKKEPLSKKIVIENDWSSVSYWYIYVGLKLINTLNFDLLFKNTFQGDAIIVKWAEKLGVKSSFNKDKLTIQTSTPSIEESYYYDANDHPDLVPTMVVWHAFLKHKVLFDNITTLIYKESNRLEALTENLKQLNVKTFYDTIKQQFSIDASLFSIPPIVFIDTFNDHRIAMAFSVLDFFTQVCYSNKIVVQKSYPNFWEEQSKVKRITALQ